jgi:hypothetical protein
MGRLATLISLLCLLTADSSAVEPVPVDQFAKLHSLIKTPPQQDQWEQIPWLTNLWEARQKAAAEGKPILLWEMDGHPLGCT